MSVHADEGHNEVNDARPFRILATRHFTDPVVEPGKEGEDSAQREDVVEVGHDVVSVVQGCVHPGVRENDASDAAHGEQEDEADRPQHWVLKVIEPPHMVAIHEKILTPVGTAMIRVAAVK